MAIKHLSKGVVTVGAVMLLLGSSVCAGTSMQKYSTTVGKFNGNGYTGYQTKACTKEDGYLYSNAVGGSYVVDVRMISNDTKAAWVRDVNDNRGYYIPGNENLKAGNEVRLQFSNDLLTPVDVQVEGEWKSN